MAKASVPAEVTREGLYREVWETPMIRLAEKYGITGNGLAKICDRLKVPYPPRGYWAKKAAGKNVATFKLPDADGNTPQRVTIRPTPIPVAPILDPEAEKQIATARDEIGDLSIPQRLARPHPIIANWLADHERRTREASAERDPLRKQWMKPGGFSPSDKRRHRILDTLFKAIKRQGGEAIQGEQRALFVVLQGQRIEIQLREKQKQVRRTLTDEEKRFRSKEDKGWRKDLQATGHFVFSIKTYLTGFRTEWRETSDQSIDSLLSDIVATLIAAAPVLAERERQRKEEERLRQIADLKRYEREQQQKLDNNRWRRFVEVAQQHRDIEVARNFITALRASNIDVRQMVCGNSVEDWIAWAEDHLISADPVSHGAEIFDQIAEVTAWSYRD